MFPEKRKKLLLGCFLQRNSIYKPLQNRITPQSAGLFHLLRCLSFLTIASLFACNAAEPGATVRLFAAASLTDAVSEAVEVFESAHPDVPVLTNFAASSILAKQIEHGAAADIYISANQEWMDYLKDKGYVAANASIPLVGNSLVMVAGTQAKYQVAALQDLATLPLNRIALADWSHVPAGIYAKEALENAGLWRQVQDRCLAAIDVRAALVYVERGEADLGIVYRSDAILSRGVKIVFTFPSSGHSPIVYPAAVLAHAGAEQAAIFMHFLRSHAVQDIFERFGFKVLNPAG